jgi:hypothetical protein
MSNVRAHMLARILAALFIVCLVLVVTAAEPKRLSGTYSLSSASRVDSPPSEPKNTHLRLYLTGGAASELYSALLSKPRRDECFDDGSLTKAEGEIMCTRHPTGSHECWLGIELRTQKVVPSFVC